MKTEKRRAAISKKKKGLFITFEGGEGVGKTTQIARLAKYFTSQGKRVVVTREPGGSTIANRIRSLLLDPKMKGLTPLAELFLYEASRSQHVVETIAPALEQGMVVICDRFTDSSVVYQGVARNQKSELIESLNQIASIGLKPDLTFFLDLDARIGLARVGSRGVMDRMEKEALSFHQKVRKGYLALVKKYPQRIKRIDASRGRDDIHEKIIQFVEEL